MFIIHIAQYLSYTCNTEYNIKKTVISDQYGDQYVCIICVLCVIKCIIEGR